MKGQAILPLLMVLSLWATLGLGMHQLLRRWHSQVVTQLLMNRCVGEFAQEYRDSLNALEVANGQIRSLRRALLAASVLGGLGSNALRLLLRARVLTQDVILLRSRMKFLGRHSRLGCQLRGLVFGRFASIRYTRPPPDALGPRMLEWPGGLPDVHEFSLRRGSLRSGARVERSHEKSPNSFTQYRARWWLNRS